MRYYHLTISERAFVYQFLQMGMGIREIARALIEMPVRYRGKLSATIVVENSSICRTTPNRSMRKEGFHVIAEPRWMNRSKTTVKIRFIKTGLLNKLHVENVAGPIVFLRSQRFIDGLITGI